MDDKIVAFEQGIKKLISEYKRVIRRKNEIEEKLRFIENALELNKGTLFEDAVKEEPRPANSMRFAGKVGLEAYKELAQIDFKGKSFNDKEMKELATKEGLLIKGKPIKPVTSLSIIGQLFKEGFLERVERGRYQIKKGASLFEDLKED